MVALFECDESRGESVRIERLIKKQKSRKLLETIINGEKLFGDLAQLVRVPHMRD